MSPKFLPGYWLELIPRDPPARMPGIVWVVRVEGLDGPLLRVVDGHRGYVMRLDENEELAVREMDGSLWEVGRAAAPDLKGMN